MLKGQNRKVKDIGRFAGRASCLGLLGLGVMLAYPTCSSASALTSEELESGSLASAVSISFTPASGSTTLSPTTAAGASGLISVLANVGVTNSGGYSVYLGSNSTNLVGKKDSSIVIPGVSGEVSFDNLQDNTWGYYAGEGSAIPESATYKAISQGQGEVIFANNNSKVKNENKTFVLGFATKIDNSIPADTYENQVTLSVVSNPYQLTLMDIDNMQDMTTAICENTDQLATKQLKDVRDGKYYWVTKLADNRCWMTQNLALDLSTNPKDNNAATNVIKTFTDADTDLNSKTSWTPNQKTYSTVTSSTILADNTGQRSWNLGSYYIKEPNGTASCGTKKSGLADCVTYFVAFETPMLVDNSSDAHYLASHYYQWGAATAGSGETIVSGEAQDSICPKGWRLPTSDIGGELQVLMNVYGVTSGIDITGDTEPLVSAPLYFVRGGGVVQGTNLFNNAGRNGAYWSSTPYSDDTNTYGLTFYGTEDILPSRYGARQDGRSIRCIAR